MDESRPTSRRTTRPAAPSPEQRRPIKPDEVSAADLRQTIGEVLRILILRRWVCFIPFCLATTAAFVASHYIPRTFEASTTFEQANDAVSVNLPPGLPIAKYEFFRSTLEEDMRSDEVMGPIVEDLGLARDLPRGPDGTLTAEGLEQRAAIGRNLATGVEMVSWKKAPFRHVIRLHYTGADPEVMVRLLQQMKDGYIGLVRRKVADKLRDARDWYTTRAHDKRTVLEEIDRQVTALQIAHPGIDPSNPESIAFQLTAQRTELAELNRSRTRLGTQVASRQEYLLQARTLRTADPANAEMLVRPLSARARRLREDVTASAARVRVFKATRGMTDLHPEIVAEYKLQDRYRRQLVALAEPRPPLAAAQAAETAEMSVGPLPVEWNPAVAQVEMEFRALVEQQGQNTTDIASTESRMAGLLQMQSNIFDRRQEMGRVHEQFERAQDEFDTYQQLVARCDQALTVENENRGILFTDVVPVEGSVVPVSPLVKTVLLLSVMAGLATGAVFVVLAELFDRRFRTSAQVIRSLKLPILESIEEIVTVSERRVGFLRRTLLVPAAAAALIGMVGLSGGLSYLSLNHPSTYLNVMSYPKSAWASVAGSAAPAQLPAARATED